jgi:DNA-binding transcriptional MerR regulator
MVFVPTKLYYKIGEVCKIVGVEAYVLRYWEREFSSLSPPKSKTGQRTYRPKDIELLLQIRNLLHEQGYTIAGARRQLSAGVPANLAASSPPAGNRKTRVRRPQSERSPERLSQVRTELENILTLLDRG